MNLRDNSIFVAGHRGLVGSALLRALIARGATRIVTRSRAQLDLENQVGVFSLFERERPEVVFLAAAKVGGIMANRTYPADFIRSNLAIQNNVIEAAHRYGTKKLLFLGSSCVYPKKAAQPITEDQLLSGPLEPTNSAYAVAKIAGIEMCRAYNFQFGSDFIVAMPTNLYGPGDNFDLDSSHVLPGLIRRFHEARVSGLANVTLWGSGSPRREFLHVDDLAEACLLLIERHSGDDLVNVGYGEDVEIRAVAEMIGRVVGYDGHVEWDTSKPDGTPRKLLDVTRMQAYGWRPRIPLDEGIRATYTWYLEHSPFAAATKASGP